MFVLPVACLKDNFAYVLYREAGGQAVVVDPSDAAPVLLALNRLQLHLTGILLTHHHWDHVGGVPNLREIDSTLPVYAHEVDAKRIEAVTHPIGSGATLETAVGTIRTLAVPGHTLGAVAYLWEDAAFTGDTLFGAGCGRLFEGTAAQMHASLTALGALPKSTRVYSGHEYTLQNLAFAANVEPCNAAIGERILSETARLAAGEPTVPSTIGRELATNPFLRCDVPEIRQRLGMALDADSTQVFAALRTLKDHFRV